jgi:hypothetical protein
MMILPPLEPTAILLHKGAKRQLFELLANEIGVSYKTIENSDSRGKLPSQRTIDKFFDYLKNAGVEFPRKLLSLRKFSKKNEWGVLLLAFQLTGLRDDIFGNLQKEIHALAELDEKLELSHANSDSFNKILFNSQISWIANSEHIDLDSGLSRRQIRSKLVIKGVRAL